MYVRRAGEQVEVWAPAKINLLLEILSRRADGYHELETLMAAVSLFDTLRFAPRPGTDSIAVQCCWAPGACGAAYDPLPHMDENLVTRALRLLKQRSGFEGGAEVTLVKRIPAAAGLGGGSSDAAAALMAGNLAWRLGWSRGQLAELASEIGSDIPFFLSDFPAGGAAAAVCRGRGEEIETVLLPAGLPIVIVRPPEGLSTAEVYRRCQVASTPRTSASLVAALARRDETSIRACMMNRLAAPAAELSASVARVSRSFARLGCVAHQLSGSGSAHFGIFRHARQARAAARRMSAEGIGQVWSVQTI